MSRPDLSHTLKLMTVWLLIGLLVHGCLMWSLALCLSYLLVVLTAPLFGTVMDHARAKKRLLFASYAATVGTTALLYFVAPGWMWLGFWLIVLSNTAYAIGESHALRQVCSGDGDQHWRDRMAELINTEAADADLETRLKQSFNSGYAARQSQFPSCGPDSRKAELAVARKGEGIAKRLAASVRTVKRMGPDDPALQDPNNPGAEPKE